MRISDWSSDVCSADLAIVGGLMFLWWLGALAAGPDAYAAFLACVWHDPSPEAGTLHQITHILGKIVLIGLSWAFFQHLFSGDRKSVVEGQRVSVRVDLGGRRFVKNKNIT